MPSLPFESMFEDAPVAASLTRRSDGRFLAVNRAWEAMTGLSRQQVLGHTTTELGLWPREQDRKDFIDTLHLKDEPRCMAVIDGRERHVRMHTSQLNVGGEELLLVYLLDIGHEAEAEKQSERTQQALQAANLDLQQQVELHGAIEKIALVGHWTNAPNDDEVIWSSGMYEITGLSPSPTLQRGTGRAGIHPDDMPAWLAAREACDGREVEFRWTRPDGQVRWMRTRISQTAVKGIPRTDFGVVQDITPQREAIQAQAEQLSLLQNITARVPGVVFQGSVPVKGWGSFQYVSDTVRDLMGLDPAQLYEEGRSLFTRVHPDDHLPMGQSIWESTSRRTLWRQVFRVIHPTKGLRWCSAEGLPQLQPDGSVLWHGYVHDVTEARQAAQDLERQHRMLDAVRHAQAAYIEADDKRQAFEGLLQAFLSVTDSAFGFVGEVLYDPQDRPYLKTHAITNIAWNEVTERMVAEQMDAGLEFRNLKTLFGHALATGKTVVTNDPLSDPRSGGLPPGHPPMTAFLGIPLSLGGRLIAMVGLANAPGGYSDDDVEFLQPLLGTVRQLVMARRGHAERQRSRLQLQATSALLAEKSSALQVTLDSISQGLSKMDSQGRVLVYNRRLLEMLDLPDELMSRQPTQDEVVGYQTARGDFGQDYALVEPLARKYIEDDSCPMPGRYMRRTRDGRALEIRTRPLPDGGMVRTYTDVTSYVQAEEALRDERQRLEWVLEATGPGIWELDVVTEQTLFSERWAALLGYRLDELHPPTRDTWRSLVHPDDLGRAQALLQAHLQGESPVYDCDLRMRHRNGDWLWFNDRGRVHQRDERGEALYMSGTSAGHPRAGGCSGRGACAQRQPGAAGGRAHRRTGALDARHGGDLLFDRPRPARAAALGQRFCLAGGGARRRAPEPRGPHDVRAHRGGLAQHGADDLGHAGAAARGAGRDRAGRGRHESAGAFGGRVAGAGHAARPH